MDLTALAVSRKATRVPVWLIDTGVRLVRPHTVAAIKRATKAGRADLIVALFAGLASADSVLRELKKSKRPPAPRFFGYRRRAPTAAIAPHLNGNGLDHRLAELLRRAPEADKAALVELMTPVAS